MSPNSRRPTGNSIHAPFPESVPACIWDNYFSRHVYVLYVSAAGSSENLTSVFCPLIPDSKSEGDKEGVNERKRLSTIKVGGRGGGRGRG